MQASCEWLLKRDEYKLGVAGDGAQLLRLIGAPGIGKTMISSFLVDHLESRSRETPGITLAYYFCDNKDEKRNNGSAILRRIILQLLEKRPQLFKCIESDYNKMRSSLTSSLDALWRVFLAMLQGDDAGEVTILVDALDECEKLSQEALVGHLADLLGASSEVGPTKIKFIVTCRPDSVIDEGLLGIGRHLAVNSGSVNADLSKFIEVKVDELAIKKNYP